MINFFSGAASMACLTIAAIFLKTWTRTADRFFLCFALAFFFFTIEKLAFLTGPTAEHQPFLYLLRLLGFFAILGGIWDKNMIRRRP